MIEKILFCTYQDQLFVSTENAEQILLDYCTRFKRDLFRLSDTKFVFYKRRRWIQYGQEVTIDIEGGYWEITSREIFPSFFDYSANYFNVVDLMSDIQLAIDEKKGFDQLVQSDDLEIEEDQKQVNSLDDFDDFTNEKEEDKAVIYPSDLQYLPDELLKDEKPVAASTHSKLEENKTEINHPEFKTPNSFVKNRPPFYANLILIGFIFLVFILMIISSQTGNINQAVIRKWGANHDLLVSNGQIHRLLFSIFIHASLLHLMGNLIILYIVGSFVEKWMSSKYYILHFLSIGIFAASASFYFHDGTFVLGSSSAIFGVLGLSVYANFTGVYPKNINRPILITNIVLMANLLYISISQDQDIDHVGHLAGFSFGILYGMLYDFFNQRSPMSQHTKPFIVPLIAGCLAMVLVKLKPTEFYQWNKMMEKAKLYKTNGDYVANNYYYFDEKNLGKEIEYAIECYDKLAILLDSIIHLKVPRGYKETALRAYGDIEKEKEVLRKLQNGILENNVQDVIYEMELKKNKIPSK